MIGKRETIWHWERNTGGFDGGTSREIVLDDVLNIVCSGELAEDIQLQVTFNNKEYGCGIGECIHTDHFSMYVYSDPDWDFGIEMTNKTKDPIKFNAKASGVKIPLTVKYVKDLRKKLLSTQENFESVIKAYEVSKNEANIEQLKTIVDSVGVIDFGDKSIITEIKSKLNKMLLKEKEAVAIKELNSAFRALDIDPVPIMKEFCNLNEIRYEKYGVESPSLPVIIKKLEPMGWENVVEVLKLSVDKNIDYSEAIVEIFQQNNENYEAGSSQTTILNTKVASEVKRRGVPTKEERVQKKIDNLDSDRKKMEEEKIANNFKLLRKENELLKKEIEILKSRDVIIKGEPIFGYQAPVLGGGELNIVPRDCTVTCGIEAKTQTSK